ncbi:MAG: aspartyl/glutamyl-tRNA amidotransferase subunit A [Deltaproteobacteria bacterium RIFCSPLOWO2_12_FULL_40_28]|nr:MAG: aspartyl/glutamyl-tRNA amidotransferase subunit A [Deltaproteobacteria bacterium RIFCSPHIGHO2_02_FULL_40_28]OGQ20415.1 MAG: aspartyl/glutamyl-tRNA amidotransferase subunit A [Deltaproteobacteria bacterium RIFCSPHIGHO2_12_FULL_40_32]OGQ41384.1 MAG: aspartyl/glutamyl-tRNA amidotransferase subunit A [Deltaproteobacteria bacterium RIFCSPLOWO2_02_FULL_40_36]OGQ55023.1 MAG: aspartyl/glutamyl-tRNA amidotransferase subunit A [Deltaproteobacteria bacterium RIFCSPLOWO2_12_FULL_40_28]
MTELTELTIGEVSGKLASKSISSVELTKAYLDRIAKIDSKVCAYLTVCSESALSQAKAVDSKRSKGETLSPLAGIPIAPKDIYLTRGIETTCASKILKGFIPPYDGTVIQKLKNEDVVILGKVNLDEFAMGSSTEYSAYKVTHNPWDLKRVPGGSSGGSAAAVAADLCAASLGTDTGGSIRQPASLCGNVGLKPTYGRVSRYGVIAFASSLDQMGPITKDVTDCALLMNAIAGYDSRDSTSINLPVPDYTQFLNQSIKGLRVGIPEEFFVEGMNAEVKTSVENAIKELQKQGALVDKVSLPHTGYAIAAYYIIAPAEASSNLARYDGVRFGLRAKSNSLSELYEKSRTEGFGPEVKRRILLGTYVLSAGYYDAYYIKAQKTRTVIRSDYEKAFQKFDVLVTPTSPTTAFAIGEKTNDPLQMYLADACTIPVNLAGLPAMSLPCGFDSKGLPIGFQLIGKSFDEGTLIKVAHAYEQTHTFPQQKPKL